MVAGIRLFFIWQPILWYWASMADLWKRFDLWLSALVQVTWSVVVLRDRLASLAACVKSTLTVTTKVLSTGKMKNFVAKEKWSLMRAKWLIDAIPTLANILAYANRHQRSFTAIVPELVTLEPFATCRQIPFSAKIFVNRVLTQVQLISTLMLMAADL